jgi:hypothetical protein
MAKHAKETPASPHRKVSRCAIQVVVTSIIREGLHAIPWDEVMRFVNPFV